MSLRKIKLEIVILTSDEDYEPELQGLEDYLIHGDGTGSYDVISDEVLSVPEMAMACEQVGSDPDFILMGEYDDHHRFPKGSIVWWADPDEDFSSGIYKVSIDTDPEIISIVNTAGSEAEVFGHEITLISPAIIVRAWEQADPDTDMDAFNVAYKILHKSHSWIADKKPDELVDLIMLESHTLLPVAEALAQYVERTMRDGKLLS